MGTVQAAPGRNFMNEAATSITPAFIGRVGVKAALLFVLLNVAFALVQPLPALNRLSLYGWLLPPRERLPFSDQPGSNNLSLNSIEAMLASHAVSRPTTDDEFRVLVLGDSSVWGILLPPADTLTGVLNAAAATGPDGRRLRFYNLGYPTMSLTKDLLLLEAARATSPDLILWLVTLQSFDRRTQLEPPLVRHNPARVRALIQRHDLRLNPQDERFSAPDFFGQTLIGRRRDLADWLRLQLYGVAWATTGIDQVYGPYTPRSNDFDADVTWQGYTDPAQLTTDALALEVLAAGHALAGEVPLLLINEPIFIADGVNSDRRYNLWYPRALYDAYRDRLAGFAAAAGWPLLDLWDSIPPAEFTDSPVHLTPAGSRLLAQQILAAGLPPAPAP
jgi:hypothetical protein